MEIMRVILAVFSRLLFFAHGIYSIYIYDEIPVKWCCTIPLIFLLLETYVTIIYMEGLELKYFWPSGFFYISTIIPLIWMFQLDLFKLRTNKPLASNVNLTLVEQRNIQSETFYEAVLSLNDYRRKVYELGLVLIVIIGRWLMPRGSLTRDQLSALVFNYVGTSADILELFSVLEEEDLMEQKSVTIAVLFVFTISVYQFALVTTATVESEEASTFLRQPSRDIELQPSSRGRFNSVEPSTRHEQKILQKNHSQKGYIDDIRTRHNTLSSANKGRRERRRKSKRKPVDVDTILSKQKKENSRKLHGEVFQNMVILVLQDGPFFLFRFSIIIQWHVFSVMHIFFTVKNAIVVILLVYRLWILWRSTGDEEEWNREEAALKLKNIQRMIRTMTLNEVDTEDVCGK